MNPISMRLLQVANQFRNTKGPAACLGTIARHPVHCRCCLNPVTRATYFFSLFLFVFWIHPVRLIMTLPSPLLVLVTLTWKMFSPRIV